ncbi:MAG: hypothetical protein COT15_03125 [Candidatus Diapherotrites archaeon CG08_land_8_20_14_0_20_34_12]|nr:MAG: hypothetical protein COT15_03125 [Candidatus Diapherotrites archaeon CG08_land_8_20_14_0_20_34_12]
MPKRPQRGKFKPKTPPLKERDMAVREAWAREAAGQRVPRGTLLTSFPSMPEVSLTRIQITFNPDGSVEIPKYEETERGDLRVKRNVRVKDASAAVRQTLHQIESIGREMKRLDVAYSRIQGVHEAVYDNWHTYNDVQKAAVLGFVEKTAKMLEPRKGKLFERHKKKAIARLRMAKEFLKAENPNAAVAVMVGAANDLIARKNVLIKQKPFLERRGKSIQREKSREDKTLYGVLDRVFKIDAALTGPRPVGPEERGRIATELRTFAQTLGERREKELKQCSALVRSAANTIEAGKVGRTLPKIRLARKVIVETASKSTILYPERLAWLGRHTDLIFRKHVVRNQLRFFADNVEYWLGKARPDQIPKMKQYLVNLANVLAGARVNSQQGKIIQASSLFEQRNIAECIGALEQTANKL